MILDITEDSELIPILGRDWHVCITNRWFAGRPNENRERKQIIEWIEKANLDKVQFIHTEMLWAFAAILDCKYVGYRMYKPNRDAYVYVFYMPVGLSQCPNSKILITLNRRLKLNGTTK